MYLMCLSIVQLALFLPLGGIIDAIRWKNELNCAADPLLIPPPPPFSPDIDMNCAPTEVANSAPSVRRIFVSCN